MIRNAIAQKNSFNVIHIATMYKVDVFLIKDHPSDQTSRDRTVPGYISGSRTRMFEFASPEDTILNKLKWYRMGHGVFDRQWIDLVNVMKVQGVALDRAYLNKWASEMNVADLLAKAWEQVELLGS